MKEKEWKDIYIHTSTTNNAHAFCTYFDDDDESWKIADATPRWKKKYLLERKNAQEKEAKNLAEFEDLRPGIEQTSGIPPLERLKEKQLLLQKQKARIDAFLTIRIGDLYNDTWWEPPADHQSLQIQTSDALDKEGLDTFFRDCPSISILRKIESNAPLEEKIKIYEQYAKAVDKAMDGVQLILERREEFLGKICIPLGSAVTQKIDTQPPHLKKKDFERLSRIFGYHCADHSNNRKDAWKEGLQDDDILKYGLYTLIIGLLKFPRFASIGITLEKNGAYHIELGRSDPARKNVIGWPIKDPYLPQDFFTAFDNYLKSYEGEVMEKLRSFLVMMEDPSLKFEELIMKLHKMTQAIIHDELSPDARIKVPSLGVQKFLGVFRNFLFGELAGKVAEQEGEKGVMVESEGRQYFLRKKNKKKKDTST